MVGYLSTAWRGDTGSILRDGKTRSLYILPGQGKVCPEPTSEL